MAAVTVDVTKITERQWQRTLVEALETFGWAVQHVFPLQTKRGDWRTGTTASGWPDLVALRDEWTLACEVKGPRTPTEISQIAWLMRFHRAGALAYLLRPTDDWDEISDWFARPWRAPRAYGWQPLPDTARAYPFRAATQRGDNR